MTQFSPLDVKFSWRSFRVSVIKKLNYLQINLVLPKKFILFNYALRRMFMDAFYYYLVEYSGENNIL